MQHETSQPFNGDAQAVFLKAKAVLESHQFHITKMLDHEMTAKFRKQPRVSTDPFQACSQISIRTDGGKIHLQADLAHFARQRRLCFCAMIVFYLCTLGACIIPLYTGNAIDALGIVLFGIPAAIQTSYYFLQIPKHTKMLKTTFDDLLVNLLEGL